MQRPVRAYVFASLLLGAIVMLLTMGVSSAPGDGACGFDLFVLSNGAARDLTNTPDMCEYRPEWSPSRQQVVYNDGAGVGLYIADVATGVGHFLPGSENGGNPSWSPDGQLIAYDRYPVGDHTVYVLPPSGGTAAAIVSDAMDVDWAPSTHRVVFVRPSDGSIHTIGIDGSGETTVAPPGSQSACLPIGCGLAWSPDGQTIAYSDLFNIWTVQIAPDGHPLAPPKLLLPGGPFYQTQLTWTGDSKTIAFNSDRAGDGGAALWSVPANGGTPTKIGGPTSTFNYDPNIARGGGAIVYSGSTS